MSNPLIKNYLTYHALLLDISHLAPSFDLEATVRKAPPLCFYTKDGLISLGGNLTLFMQKLRDVTGLKVVPASCQEFYGQFQISYEDYAPVETAPLEKIEIAPVDTPARKKAARKKKS